MEEALDLSSDRLLNINNPTEQPACVPVKNFNYLIYMWIFLGPHADYFDIKVVIYFTALTNPEFPL